MADVSVAYAVRIGLRSGVWRGWSGPEDADDLPVAEPTMETPPPPAQETSRRAVKVGDFGLANFTANQIAFVGSALYAPGQVSSTPQARIIDLVTGAAGDSAPVPYGDASLALAPAATGPPVLRAWGAQNRRVQRLTNQHLGPTTRAYLVGLDRTFDRSMNDALVVAGRQYILWRTRIFLVTGLGTRSSLNGRREANVLYSSFQPVPLLNENASFGRQMLSICPARSTDAGNVLLLVTDSDFSGQTIFANPAVYAGTVSPSPLSLSATKLYDIHGLTTSDPPIGIAYSGAGDDIHIATSTALYRLSRTPTSGGGGSTYRADVGLTDVTLPEAATDGTDAIRVSIVPPAAEVANFKAPQGPIDCEVTQLIRGPGDTAWTASPVPWKGVLAASTVREGQWHGTFASVANTPRYAARTTKWGAAAQLARTGGRDTALSRMRGSEIPLKFAREIGVARRRNA